jgi:hypothetical protein
MRQVLHKVGYGLWDAAFLLYFVIGRSLEGFLFFADSLGLCFSEVK